MPFWIVSQETGSLCSHAGLIILSVYGHEGSVLKGNAFHALCATLTLKIHFDTEEGSRWSQALPYHIWQLDGYCSIFHSQKVESKVRRSCISSAKKAEGFQAAIDSTSTTFLIVV